jgi:pantothenate synthetase
MPELASNALVAVAAFVGNTRLIDNILLPPEPM